MEYLPHGQVSAEIKILNISHLLFCSSPVNLVSLERSQSAANIQESLPFPVVFRHRLLYLGICSCKIFLNQAEVHYIISLSYYHLKFRNVLGFSQTGPLLYKAQWRQRVYGQSQALQF